MWCYVIFGRPYVSVLRELSRELKNFSRNFCSSLAKSDFDAYHFRTRRQAHAELLARRFAVFAVLRVSLVSRAMLREKLHVSLPSRAMRTDIAANPPRGVPRERSRKTSSLPHGEACAPLAYARVPRREISLLSTEHIAD